MLKFFKILAYGRPYRKYIYWYMLFVFLSIIFGTTTLGLVMPFLDILFNPEKLVTPKPEVVQTTQDFLDLLKFYVNDFAKADPKAALLFVCIAVLISALAKNLFLYLSRYFLIPFRNNTIRDLRNEFYKKTLRLPMSHFTEEKKGDLISRMSQDITEIQICMGTSLEAIFRDPITIVIYLTILILLSPKLSLIIFILLPVAALVISSIGKRIKSDSARSMEKQSDLMSSMDETLGGIRIIKAFHNAPYFLRKFVKQNEILTRISNAIMRRKDLSSPLSETLGITTLCVILWFGGNMVFRNEIPASAFIGYLALFSQLIPPAKSFADSFFVVQKALASKERIDEILAINEKIADDPDAQSVSGFGHKIELRNVSFKYEDRYVLEDINLTINKGETVALIGPSGGGKSTLADLIIRFYDVTEGEILIDGINIKKLKIADLRKLLGVVSQESILFNDSVYSNIAFGNHDVSPADIIKAATVANAHTFIDSLERQYQTVIGERGSKLSGGQRQRVAIARAVLRNPEILILDEATSALDNASEKLVQNALENLMRGRTSIVIAHRLSTIQHADKIVVLQSGRIVQTGNHATLIGKEGLYRELYQMQHMNV